MSSNTGDRRSEAPNFTFERPAGSHTLAAAAQRGR